MFGQSEAVGFKQLRKRHNSVDVLPSMFELSLNMEDPDFSTLTIDSMSSRFLLFSSLNVSRFCIYTSITIQISWISYFLFPVPTTHSPCTPSFPDSSETTAIMKPSTLLPFLPTAIAGTYQQITNFGSNPTNVGMYLYTPDKLASNPPLVVVPHWCHGSAQAAYSGSPFTYTADTYGFPVLYPDSPNQADKCWDVSSNQTLTHNGGGDSLGIVSAVKYVAKKYNVNAKRIFVQGTSSGAMMTNVLLGSYPDVFAAGSAWAGVAFACFAGDGFGVWSDPCATGTVIKTGAEWSKIVKAAYPGYNGWRPKLQVFHGDKDNVLYPQNFQEEIKEWTSVFGLSETPTQTLQNTPISGWTKYVYGDGSKFTATLAAGVDHNIQTQLQTVLDWFQLTCSGSNCFGRPDTGIGGNGSVPTVSSVPVPTSASSAAPSTTSSPSAPTQTGGNPAQQWGQWSVYLASLYHCCSTYHFLTASFATYAPLFP